MVTNRKFIIHVSFVSLFPGEVTVANKRKEV